MSAEYENVYFMHNTKIRDRPPLWDSFQDPPKKKASGSSANWKKLEVFMKLFKIFVYIFVFAVVLTASVLSKLTYIFMTGNIRADSKIDVCARQFSADATRYSTVLPEAEQVVWVWALICAYAVPELFTFLRALRICTFKDVKSPTWQEALLVIIFEIFHVIGLALLTFSVLPLLDVTRAVMICCCVCLVPAVLNLLMGTHCNWRALLVFGIGVLVVAAQVSAFVVWPLYAEQINLQILGIPLILISFRWWENFINVYAGFANYIRTLRNSRSRYRSYLFLAPLKVTLFGLLAFILHGESFGDYFALFMRAWHRHDIRFDVAKPLTSVPRNLTQSSSRDVDFTGALSEPFIMQSNPYAVLYTMLLQVCSSYLCYIFGKFACKIKIQVFSFSLPLSLASPVTLALATIASQRRARDVCVLHDFIPDYLTLHTFDGDGSNADALNLLNVILEHCLWLWPLWWLSQLWTCIHIWQPRNDKNSPTEKLFVCPWYCGFLVDQCIMLNRRIVDWNEEYLTIKKGFPKAKYNATTTTNDIQESDRVPQLLVCATMWHETQKEMMEFLKSIVRLDEDQCARRMAKTHINAGKVDDEYYELETNIFFDDAFVLDEKHCENARNPPMNEYVKTLIKSIDKAAFEVYGVNIRIKPPIKLETPYGGRLVWNLPGRTKLIAHLKNKDMIRHKKRWSQVMYMYYLLGFRLMELEHLSARRKAMIAENTFLLALDGDIDFQPRAVQLLIDRMKAVDELGAACGRIHPVGRGPLVWYQKFEYAIGHWLQKATEHVIGCVLCSPGCFSLFRASALMENSVMKKYTRVSQAPMHYVQYDQGEDRWLCTLLLKQGWRVEYSAAADAYTHSPEIFNEFYNQRRRWVPSTIANLFDILSDADTVVQHNSSISMPYIMYQGMLMIGTVLGPGTIFLMMVGALVAVFEINIWTAFLWNFFPLLTFIISCIYLKQKFQLLIAFVISTVYCLVMMAVLIGVIVQIMEDGPLAPASLFFLLVAAQITISGLMHPQEVLALLCGVIYYITIPSMYMLLMIYSVFNMNDISWGTREAPAATDVHESHIAAGNGTTTSSSHAYERCAEKPSGWLNDAILNDAELCDLTLLEKLFWRGLIKQYLQPLFQTKEEKAAIAAGLDELRNMIAFAFVMVNAIFVLIVFLLQLKKDFLHLNWPIDPADFISFDRANSQVYIYRQYKELDPIGLCFIVFFGFILIIQFIAMFFHRFATLSHLLAATHLDWFRTSSSITDEDAAKEIKGNAVNIARQLQRPKRFDEDDDNDDDDDDDDGDTDIGNDCDRANAAERVTDREEHRVRRPTICRLHKNYERPQQDYSDLPKNFERRFFDDDEIKLKNLALNRKSVLLLNQKRSIAKQRHSTNEMVDSAIMARRRIQLEYDNPAYESYGHEL